MGPAQGERDIAMAGGRPPVLPILLQQGLRGLGAEGVTAELSSAERHLHAKRRELVRLAIGGEERSGLVMRSEATHRVPDLALRVAKVESTPLMTDESG